MIEVDTSINECIRCGSRQVILESSDDESVLYEKKEMETKYFCSDCKLHFSLITLLDNELGYFTKTIITGDDNDTGSTFRFEENTTDLIDESSYDNSINDEKDGEDYIL